MDQTFRWRFIGLANYAKLFKGDPLVPRIVRNTVIYVSGALPITIGFGLLVSLLTARMKKPLALFFRAIFFLPRVIPPVVWAFLWAWAFEGSRYGIFNSILTSLGFPKVYWFIKYSMIIVILANGFMGVSLAMLVFTSAMASIPTEYLWAAEVDGASYWQLCRFIIIPLLRWPIFTMTVWHLMSFINSYVYILLITNGGPYYSTEVWSLYGYHNAFQYYKYGYGSSLIMVLIVINTILFLLCWKLFGARRALRGPGVEA